jgi:hypothetical protein
MNLQEWAKMTPANRDSWVSQQNDVEYLSQVIEFLDNTILPLIDFAEANNANTQELKDMGGNRALVTEAIHLMLLRIENIKRE